MSYSGSMMKINVEEYDEVEGTYEVVTRKIGTYTCGVCEMRKCIIENQKWFVAKPSFEFGTHRYLMSSRRALSQYQYAPVINVREIVNLLPTLSATTPLYLPQRPVRIASILSRRTYSLHSVKIPMTLHLRSPSPIRRAAPLQAHKERTASSL